MLTTFTIYRPARAMERQQVRLPEWPGADALKAVVEPLLDDADVEHVSVLYQERRADMFVDCLGATKALPRNDKATALYRAAALKRQPSLDPESLPAVYGTAILFHRIVWR